MHSCDQPTSATLNLTLCYITQFSRFIRFNAGHRAGQARPCFQAARPSRKSSHAGLFPISGHVDWPRKYSGCAFAISVRAGPVASISLNFSFSGMSLQCWSRKPIRHVMPVSLILDTGPVPWHHQVCPLWLVSLLTCTAFL
jgi:hypothetical protein